MWAGKRVEEFPQQREQDGVMKITLAAQISVNCHQNVRPSTGSVQQTLSISYVSDTVEINMVCALTEAAVQSRQRWPEL